MIYAIEVVGHDAVKIGYAKDANAVSGRLKIFQISSPFHLRLVATRDGDIALEHALHRAWRQWRIRGEWFTRDVLPLFDGATGERAVVLRCSECGAARRVVHTRARASGLCRACASKQMMVMGSQNWLRDNELLLSCCDCGARVKPRKNVPRVEWGALCCRGCAMKHAWLDPEYKLRRERSRLATLRDRRLRRDFAGGEHIVIQWDNIPLTQ